MPYKFFRIPIHDSAAAEAELNSFLGNHRILGVDRRCMDQGGSAFWAICVDYETTTATAASGGAGRKGKVDYREILAPDDFTLFAQLREWRKETAAAEAVPVYTIFSNEHLRQMVEQRVSTLSALSQISGVGEAKAQKYGSRVLEIVKRHEERRHEAERASVSTDRRAGQPAAGLS